MADGLNLPNLEAELTLDLSALADAVGEASRAVAKIAGAMDTQGQQAGAALASGVERGATKGAAIGGAIGGVVSGGMTTALDAVTTFTTGSVDAFAQLEDATAAAGVLFGDNVGAITSAAENAASTVGLSTQQYIDAAGTIGTFGQAAGLQGPALTDFTNKLTGLSGDLASFKGTSTEQAVEAVGAALRGESEPIRAYGVLLDEATIAQEAQRIGLVKAQVDHVKVASAKAALGSAQQRLDKVMHDSKATDADKASAQAAVARAEQQVKNAMAGSTPELSKQQKLMATQSAILRQTTNAQGDFARTSDSTANTQKRLAAESANAQAQLGAKLAPALTALRLGLLAVITSISGLIGWIQQNMDVLGPLAAVIGIVTLALSANAIATGVASAATAAWTAVQAALNFVMSANPIALVVIAIALLVGAIIIAYKRSETFRAIVDAAFSGIRVAITASMNAARAVVGAVMAFINGDVTGKLGQVRAVVGAVFSFFTSIIRTQLAAARAIISGVLNVIVGLFTGDFGRARDGAVQALGGLLRFVGTVPSKILGALGKLGGLLVHAGAELMQGLADGITARAQAVVDKVKAVADRIKGFFPGSPVREGPLTSWNGGAAGARLGDLLVSGLDASTADIAAAAGRAAEAANTALEGSARVSVAGVTSTGAAAPATGGATLVDLSPATLAALAAVIPAPLLQVLLDSDPIAHRVNEKLGNDAAAYERAGG